MLPFSRFILHDCYKLIEFSTKTLLEEEVITSQLLPVQVKKEPTEIESEYLSTGTIYVTKREFYTTN